MPIEILEMVVTAELTEDKTTGPSIVTNHSIVENKLDKEHLIEEIFNQVISYLEHQIER